MVLGGLYEVSDLSNLSPGEWYCKFWTNSSVPAHRDPQVAQPGRETKHIWENINERKGLQFCKKKSTQMSCLVAAFEFQIWLQIPWSVKKL